MRSPLLALFLVACAIGTAWAKVQMVPLLALRMARQGQENMLWMEQRVKMGGESVNGYIQGTGGGDDALMAFELEEEWDLLEATIGFLNTTPEGRSAEFTVESGGVVLYSSGVLDSKGPVSRIRVPLKGNRRVVLRISSERYNGTAGAAWGAPTLYKGLSKAELETSWTLKVNGHSSPLSGSGAPREVLVPVPVPSEAAGAEEYTVKIRRDPETRTLIVEREVAEP